MALKGHVFNKQIFSSDCFSLFIHTFLNGNDGIVKGCNLSNTNDSISITSGYFCIQGRFLQEEGGSTFNIEPTTTTDKFCQLICELDMSQDNTTSQLNQAYYKIIESTTGYTTLIQQNLNDGGTKYQFEFARFKVTEVGIQEVEDKRLFLDFDSMYGQINRQVISLINELRTSQQTEFNEWIAMLQDVLDENTAANLLNLINGLESSKANQKKTYNITIDTTWTGSSAPYTKTINVNGILATDIPLLDVIYSNNNTTALQEKEEFSKINKIVSNDGSISLTCFEEKPTITLNGRIEVIY